MVKGLRKIKDPLLFINYTKNVGYDDVVEIIGPNGERKNGTVLEITEDIAIIQCFENTMGLSVKGTKIHFLNDSYKIGVSKDMLGRIFDGLGQPKDNMPKPAAKKYKNINGSPINPVKREYPRDFIQTGISAIDCLYSLVRGQKLPIFSGFGLPHNKIAGQIIRQARLKEKEETIVIIFVALGIGQNDVFFLQKIFEEPGIFNNVAMFLNLADDPPIERLLTPRIALTLAEYLAFEKEMHVLVLLSDMSAYAEALREVSSSKGEIPSRKGYPGYLYTDLANIYERAGRIKDINGSITQIPILTMPNDDITHPIPDLTGYITEGQIVLDRNFNNKSIYPPIKILDSLSRLMKDGIGKGKTREDHPDIASQLYSCYSKYKEVQELSQIIGERELSKINKDYMRFGREFTQKFIKQDWRDNRTMEETLDLAWKTISLLPKSELGRVPKKFIDKYYQG
ncbi:MAG: V-type ATP synthase subunit B [Candidatus Lokiarchaeota archaeon]|nr:V-type ATP synthase subunit B [Candidatus Lokiarchaeota archaeon]